jgi:hypothetical protein
VTSYAAKRMSLLYAEMAVLYAASFFCVSRVFFSLVCNVFLYQIYVCFIWNECYSVIVDNFVSYSYSLYILL